MKETNIRSIYERTLQNCLFYQKEGKKQHLLNEIGALRGIVYCMELLGEAPHDKALTHFISLQEKMKEDAGDIFAIKTGNRFNQFVLFTDRKKAEKWLSVATTWDPEKIAAQVVELQKTHTAGFNLYPDSPIFPD